MAIWKYKGRDLFRGVVALGEVLTEPADMELRDEDDPYWVGHGVRPLPPRAPRVRVRYVRPSNLPLWMDLGTGSVVDELSVSRAQGGTAFRILEGQWARLLAEAGGWPEATSDVTSEPKALEDAIRGRSGGQGFGLDTLRRRAVERRAMALVAATFSASGWLVTDVSPTSPYDLLCERNAERRQVEVKGTTGGPEVVLLTRNEVVAARANPGTAVLAVVHAITLRETAEGPEGEGGELLLIDPWTLDEGILTPLAYRYLVPQTGTIG